ncbi:MAG: cyclophilin-like family protein [Nitrososphaeraceae archaeon]
MKRNIRVIFPDLGYEEIKIELDVSVAPKTVEAILANLPVNVNINRWGDELYTDNTSIVVQVKENAKTEVSELDFAYWPDGYALCLFFGPTPISEDGRILAYSPVNVVGKIVYSNKVKLLNMIKGKMKVNIDTSE